MFFNFLYCQVNSLAISCYVNDIARDHDGSRLVCSPCNDTAEPVALLGASTTRAAEQGISLLSSETVGADKSTLIYQARKADFEKKENTNRNPSSALLICRLQSKTRSRSSQKNELDLDRQQKYRTTPKTMALLRSTVARLISTLSDRCRSLSAKKARGKSDSSLQSKLVFNALPSISKVRSTC